jgi:cobalt-zinc-cadmium efflux system protein
LRQSLNLCGVPFEIDRAVVDEWLGRQDGVQSLHDLHIRSVSTTRTAPAAHLVRDRTDLDTFMDWMVGKPPENHGSTSVTLKLERRPCNGAGDRLLDQG